MSKREGISMKRNRKFKGESGIDAGKLIEKAYELEAMMNFSSCGVVPVQKIDGIEIVLVARREHVSAADVSGMVEAVLLKK